MGSDAKTYPPLAKTLLLGLLAIGALSLPPLELLQRVDGIIFDAWSRTTPPIAPSDIIIVNLDEPTWYPTLARIAQEQGARLLVSTLVSAPADGDKTGALGPIAIATADSQLLRDTEWTRGGYLWPQQDLDGVIRHERPLMGNNPPLPSLAFAASIALQYPDQPVLLAHDVIAYSELAGVDGEGRRWLRYFDPTSFQQLTPSQVLEAPTSLERKIVIVGQSTGEHHLTPVGTLTTQELLAQEFAGYWLDSAITYGSGSRALVWGLTILMLLAVGALQLSPVWNTTIPVLGVGVLLAGSAGAFIMGGLWYPTAGPVLLALLGGGYGAWTGKRRSQVGRESGLESRLQEARRLVARGSGVDAWRLYQQLPPDPGQVSELYDLGRTLALRGERSMASDIFHRIAKIDPLYRDVADRLKPTSNDIETPPGHAETLPSLGRYHLMKKIGRGAMGIVYLGRDPKLNRMVALKTIDLAKEFEVENIDEVRDRFLREAKIAGRLSHPNIVTIFDAGEEKNVAYIAMELLRGGYLSDYTTTDRLLPVATICELLARAAKALDYAHRQNVVHRDIKPSNIMYDSATDSLKLTDFGIARVMDVSRTRTGIVLGTPSFMSPEQLEGKKVNGQTDLFSLGVSLYQLLTGQLPFRGTSMTELMFSIVSKPHQPVTVIRNDLPERLNAVMDMALAKDSSDRFASGAEMAHALLREVVVQAA